MFNHTFSIPETVVLVIFLLIGGILFYCITLIGYSTGSFSFYFDKIMSALLLTVFFRTVEFSASSKVLKMTGLNNNFN